jgi:Fe-S cluster assembly protein SufD
MDGWRQHKVSTPAYAEIFERFAAEFPAPLRTARESALQAFQQSGLPHRKLEDWRYTDLSALASKSFELGAAATAELPQLGLADTELHAFINGGKGTVTALPAGSNAVTQLNASFAREGFNLHLQANQRAPRPFHVLTWCESTPATMAHLRHRIHLDPGAEATVILHHSGVGEYFTTQVTEIELGANSQLTLYRFQDESAGSYHLAETQAQLGRDSRLTVVNIDLGAGLARQDLNVTLAEPGASVELHGLYAPAGKAHVDNHTRIDHRAPRCSSREFFRGLAMDQARAVFNGKIVVHAGAQKTDSEQRVANLILSKTAEINAKPELEIYADDVKCAHGATFGQLDNDALFYLRSRGLARNSASALLTYTFAQKVLRKIGHEELRARITARFLKRLPDGAGLLELLEAPLSLAET